MGKGPFFGFGHILTSIAADRFGAMPPHMKAVAGAAMASTSRRRARAISSRVCLMNDCTAG